jgi:outer membrane lipopolysaccharide assembly protein LptE/RlpB
VNRLVLPAAALILAAGLSASCGYSLAGRGSFLPESVQAIAIPNFANRTPYPTVEQVLTERVRSEFIGRGRYKVLPQESGADAVLNAEITNISISPASFNENQQANRYTISIAVSARLVESGTEKVLWQNPNQVFREEYALASGGSDVLDPAAFFGGSSTAVERLASDFAQALVTAILEAF